MAECRTLIRRRQEEDDTRGRNISEEEIEQALITQKEYEANQRWEAKEEAEKSEVCDLMVAQKFEPGKTEKKNKRRKIKKARIKWYNKSIFGRYFPSTLTNVRIFDPNVSKIDLESILLEVGRANGVVRVEKLSWIHLCGLSEWAELSQILRKSKIKYQDTIIKHINSMIKKLTNIRKSYNLKPSSAETEHLQKL
ncbi:hypothetical protein L6452_01623 [Arctium lappa]|uniref:Uncharacterized protein n=1 Tax=Arctium lappa TaxID=4217 RepID=A0ACB9FGV1_ARCLA|nr:hypothetical protein L6452_01623 [Arctium lappa]